jgi:hypothetical protein
VSSLVAILSTVINVFLVAVISKMAERTARLEHDNRVLWDQVERYDEFVRQRIAEAEQEEAARLEAQQRAAILN